MKPNFIADIEMSLTVEELTFLKKLADQQKLSVPDCARNCMMERCIELLND